MLERFCKAKHTNGSETVKRASLPHCFIMVTWVHTTPLLSPLLFAFTELKSFTSAQQAFVVVICGYKCPVGTDVRATNALRQHAEKYWSSIKAQWHEKQEVLLDIMSAAPKLRNRMLFFLSFLNPDLCYCHPIITLFLWQWFITRPKGNTILRTYRRHN